MLHPKTIVSYQCLPFFTPLLLVSAVVVVAAWLFTGACTVSSDLRATGLVVANTRATAYDFNIVNFLVDLLTFFADIILAVILINARNMPKL
jgi:hypothetical protein